MIHQRLLLTGLLVADCSVVAIGREAGAGDYVWARSGWGNGNWGRNYGGMSNGYGGYFVPRNARGNNYELRPPFKNPNGYIVPAQVGPNSATRQCDVPAVPVQSIPVQQPVVPPLR